MPTPALNIPVRANLDEFRKTMNDTSSLAGTATRKIAQQFLNMNSEIAATAGAAGARWALGWAGKIALVVGSLKLMGDAVSAIRDQIQSMVDIADKAQSTGFSPEFWQNWVNGAKGAEKQIDAFEGALQHAFQALKPVLNPDWSVWDDGVKKVTAIETAMREMRELFSTDQDFSGFELFKNADSQDQQVAAVLTYMKQLKAIGQDVAALDLAEKLFGSSFADKVRTNQVSIDTMLDNIRTKSPDAFSNELVLRAKEIDDQLKNAWRTIDQNLHPSMETLDSIALSLKSTWADIVDLMAKASKLLNPNLTGSNTVAVQLAATGEAGFQTPILDGSVTQDQKITPDPIRVPITGGQEQIPLPRRRPNDIPKPDSQGAGGVDRFNTAADSADRRIAGLQAEAAAVDLGTAAREKSRLAAQLETVAKQANAAAGLGENVVTAQQRDRINEVADAYGKAAQGLEKAKVASSINFDRQTAFLSQEDVAIAQQLKGLYGDDVPAALASTEAAAIRANNAMREIANTGRQELSGFLVDFKNNLVTSSSAWDAFKKAGASALNSISDRLAKMASDKLWESAFGGGSGLGSLFGLGGGGSSAAPSTMMIGDYAMPKFANGTDNAPGGLAMINERGGEIVNLPSGAQVIPHDVSMAMARSAGVGAGDSVSVPVSIHVDATGADAAGLTRVEQSLAQIKAELPARIVSEVSKAQKQRRL